MADNRTGLSASDLAEQFRDVCGDGSMEWVYTPMQTWLLLDAADMLDENARLRSCLADADENARLIMGEVAELREERDTYRDLVGCMVHPDILDQLYAENVKLRELVREMYRLFVRGHDWGPWCVGETAWVEDRMRELGVTDHD